MFCDTHKDRPGAGECRACGHTFCSRCASDNEPRTLCTSCAVRERDARGDAAVQLKLVAHCRDGRVLKGITTRSSLSLSAEGFFMDMIRGERNGTEVFVPFRDLKSVYHVRDFEGDPAAKNGNGAGAHVESHILGERVSIRYADGERLEGFLTGKYRAESPRFSVIPGNGSSNNISILVERSAVDEVILDGGAQEATPATSGA